MRIKQSILKHNPNTFKENNQFPFPNPHHHEISTFIQTLKNSYQIQIIRCLKLPIWFKLLAVHATNEETKIMSTRNIK